MGSNYGFCPTCGHPGVKRERRPDGDDTCEHGHVYPSRMACEEPPYGSPLSVWHIADATEKVQPAPCLPTNGHFAPVNENAAVREAVEFFAVMDNDCVDQPDEVKRQAEILCRAVQAPRLTPEQMEAVKLAETLITDTMSDYGDCEHDVGHCICKYHSGVFNLRAAFPGIFAGEVDRG